MLTIGEEAMTKQEMVDLYIETNDFHEVKRQSGLPPYLVHIILTQAGVLKIQDKIQYGNKSQKLGGEAEALFQKLVPKAIDANRQFKKNNPVYDFVYRNLTIDVKYSSARINKRYQTGTISWSVRAQGNQDIIVAFLEREKGSELNEPYILLIPMNFIDVKEHLMISKSGVWFNEFQVKADDLEMILDSYADLLEE